MAFFDTLTLVGLISAVIVIAAAVALCKLSGDCTSC